MVKTQDVVFCGPGHNTRYCVLRVQPQHKGRFNHGCPEPAQEQEQDGYAGSVGITLGGSVVIDSAALPDPVMAEIKKTFRWINPSWRIQSRRMAAVRPPEKYLPGFYVAEDGMLHIPRASVRHVIDILQKHHIVVSITDSTTSAGASFPIRPGVDPGFEGLERLCNKRFGILGVRGSGDDDIPAAAAVIAARAQRTLVVVKSKDRLYRWRNILLSVFDVDDDAVGLVGDRHHNTGADLVVGIDRSLYKNIKMFCRCTS